MRIIPVMRNVIKYGLPWPSGAEYVDLFRSRGRAEYKPPEKREGVRAGYMYTLLHFLKREKKITFT